MNDILVQNLKEAKLKVTPQRLAIYSYLMNTTSHPSVETIYNDLKPLYNTMSLATVYKNVATLRDAHLVTEFNVGEDSHRYDANTNFHTHLVCKYCHNVYDYFQDINLNSTKKNISELGFEVEEQEVIFFGKCKNCKDK